MENHEDEKCINCSILYKENIGSLVKNICYISSGKNFLNKRTKRFAYIKRFHFVFLLSQYLDMTFL